MKKNLAAAWLTALLSLIATGALAQTFPERPISLVVGFPPGGATDTMARLIGTVASRSLAHPIVVENKPGASAVIATQYVKRSKPDGHTLLVGGNIFTVSPTLISPPPYDPVRDFQPIAMLLTSDLVLLVNAESPVKSLAELVVAAKGRPEGLSYSSTGIGTVNHLLGEMFKGRTGAAAVHVPFNGDAPAMQALLAKNVDFLFVQVSSAMGFIESGKLRPLAVASRARSPKLPQVPTTAEAGVNDLELQIWFGILAPAGLPKPVQGALFKAFAEAVESPEVRAKAAQLATNIQILPAEDMAREIERQTARSAALMKEAGIKPQ